MKHGQTHAPPRDELDNGLRRRQGLLEVADVAALIHEAQAAVGHVPLKAVCVELRVQDLVLWCGWCGVSSVGVSHIVRGGCVMRIESVDMITSIPCEE